MSVPTASDSRRLRTVVVALTATVAGLGTLMLLGLCAAVLYIAWKHPSIVEPLGAAVGVLGAIGTVAAAIFAGITALRPSSRTAASWRAQETGREQPQDVPSP
jgi:hypothetical protein